MSLQPPERRLVTEATLHDQVVTELARDATVIDLAGAAVDTYVRDAGITGIVANLETEEGYPPRPLAPIVLWRGPTDARTLGDFKPGVDLWAQTGTPPAARRFFTDFTEDTVGAPPAGWSAPWAAYSSTNVIEEAGNRFLRVNKQAGVGMYTWDAIPETADVEVVTKFRLPQTLLTSTVRMYDLAAVRVAGGTTDGSGYAGRIRSSATEAQLAAARYVDATAVQVPNQALPVPGYVDMGWNWMRMRASGAALSIKVWSAAAAEPAPWTVTVSDANLPGAGKVGLGGYIYTTYDIDCFGVALDGATAPTEALT